MTRFQASIASAVVVSATCLVHAHDAVMVVAFGDSTTAPRRIDGKPLRVYADILADRLPKLGIDATVLNAGVGGNTTAMALRRFERDVLAFHPTLAVVQFGINDSAVDVWKKPPVKAPRLPLDAYRKNLRHIVTTLRKRKTTVIVMTPNPLRWTPKLKHLYGKPPYKPDDPDGFNVLLKGYAAAVRELAAELNVPLVDVYKAFESFGNVDALLLDGMHPNTQGQALVAKLLLEQIAKLAKAGQLVQRPWQRIGPHTLLNPRCREITPPTPHETISGTGLARLADGRVVMIYAVGNPYGPPGSTYVAMRTTQEGVTWSDEHRVAHHPECQATAPSVLVDGKGVVRVFYLGFHKHAWKNGNPTSEDRSDLWTIRSTDGGRTWGDKQMIYRGYTGATNGAIETRGGNIVVPFSHYVSDPGRLVSRTVVSSDRGKTWQLSEKLDIGGRGDHDGAIEPAVVQLRDGRIWMVIRTTRGQFWQAFSSDAGLAWSKPTKTNISATNAPCHVDRLADGRLAFAWNPRHHRRHELRLRVSRDEARTWHDPIVIAWGKQVTYPFVFERKPGELWLGFHDVGKGWGRQTARIVRVDQVAAR